MNYIRSEIHEHVLIITLNRPEARNAFNRTMADEMEATIDRYDDDHELRAAIVRAEGPTFSAGQDLKAAREEGGAATVKRGGFGILNKPPAKPLIAAVEGQALGGGLELTLVCDMIVASKSAVFGLPEASRGVAAAGGGCFRLPRRIPYQIAMEIILTAEPQSAADMYRLGYVNRLVEQGAALEKALELAVSIALCAPLAIRASKEMAWLSTNDNWSDEQCWKAQETILHSVRHSEDRREGLRAFAEKRAPVWKGR